MQIFKKIHLRKIVYKLIIDCIRHPQHSVGIFAGSNFNMLMVYNEIIKCMLYNEIEKEYRSIKNQISIRLVNGSVIDIFDGTANRCMRRYTTIIYDKALDKKYVDTIIMNLVASMQRNSINLYGIHKIGL